MQLRKLDLGSNRLRAVEGLEALPNLQELYLGKNKITEIRGLGGLPSLRILDMQSNRLVDISGFAQFAGTFSGTLEEVYMSHNGIREIAGVDGFKKLNTLDLSNNRIKEINEQVGQLPLLEEFWFNNNGVSTFEEVEHLLPCKLLKTVYLTFCRSHCVCLRGTRLDG